MFISKRRFILKTCGTTTPLLCLEPLLLLTEQYAGFTEVEDLFYSRKNYKRPELQVTPHKDFDQEVALLDSLFPDGVAYCMGAVNKDCWYLYTLNPFTRRAPHQPLPPVIEEPDQTLEILMTDLDPEIMSIFSKEESLNATEATKVGRRRWSERFVNRFDCRGPGSIKSFPTWLLMIFCSNLAVIRWTELPKM